MPMVHQCLGVSYSRIEATYEYPSFRLMNRSFRYSIFVLTSVCVLTSE